MIGSRWLIRGSVGLVIGLLIIVLVRQWNQPIESDSDRMLQDASELLAAERFEEAGALTWKIMHGPSPREQATWLAARAGAKLKRSHPSFRRQPCDSPLSTDATLEQIYDRADRLLDAGRVREAEQVLAQDAHQVEPILCHLRLTHIFFIVEAASRRGESFRQRNGFPDACLIVLGELFDHNALIDGDIVEDLCFSAGRPVNLQPRHAVGLS